MNLSSRHLMTIFALILILSSCDNTHQQKEISLEDTNSTLNSIELPRLEFPTESLAKRAERIQEILSPHELTVTISDTLDPSREVDWFILPKPTMVDVMRFTCGVRGIYWKVVPGGLEFHDAQSIRDTSTDFEYDEDDPFGPPKKKQ